ncbi:MAG TPA: hypothetical protein VMU76_11470 [Acidimicrobiales bacterium]|nr:hypothetical protein [Acidimicrobiales bacterium]
MEMTRQAIELLRSALAAAPPELVQAGDAARMVAAFAEVERVGAAGKALYARRVEATAAYQDTGHRNAASWLADLSGESVGHAMAVLETTRRLETTPAVLDAFARGEISAAQAKEVAGAGVQDPSTADELLRSARTESFRDLRARAARAKRHARGEEEEQAREARAHAGRYFRSWEPEEGGVRFEAWLTKRDGARVLTSVEAEAKRVFREARTEGVHEPHERYRADALVHLCKGGRPGPGARVLVRVDAGALTRGNVQRGEVCEIAGVGPVPVATARELMGDAVFNVLVFDGIDVTCVTSTKRTIPASLRVALMERDPVCVVPGCTAAHQLEIDHWQQDYNKDGPTRLSNLARLCKPHHDLHSYRGWHLEGGPGQWRWIGPGGKAPPGSTVVGPEDPGFSSSEPTEITSRTA